MNERDAKAKARKLLKPHCYIQSMSSLATAGTPDLWLSAKRDLWVEWKHDEVTKGAIKPKLTALQILWLNSRVAEGRNVMVVCTTSSKEGIIYTDNAWNTHWNLRISFDEIIQRILKEVL